MRRLTRFLAEWVRLLLRFLWFLFKVCELLLCLLLWILLLAERILLLLRLLLSTLLSKRILLLRRSKIRKVLLRLHLIRLSPEIGLKRRSLLLLRCLLLLLSTSGWERWIEGLLLLLLRCPTERVPSPGPS